MVSPPQFKFIASVILTISADTAHLEAIGDLIRKTARAAGFKENEVRALELAVDELVSNAIVHGYRRNPAGRIALKISVINSGIVIVLEEQGRFFNPLKIAEPNLNAKLMERKVGGLGLYIMRKIVDVIYYQYLENKTKRFTLVKRT